MYTRSHGHKHVKSLTQYARKLYKRAWSKTRRKQDKTAHDDRHAEPRCPYCDDNHCGGWCG